jgi:hypothetical protein
MVLTVNQSGINKVLQKTRDLFIVIILLAYMGIDLGALRKNPHWIHTMVPIAYWILVMDYQQFPVFDYRLYYLAFGVIITVVQFHYLNIYSGQVNIDADGKGALKVDTSRKLSFGLILFSTVAYVYGFKTFLHMISTTPMNLEILALIIVYLVGIVYIISMVIVIAVLHRNELGKFLEIVK